MDIIETLFGFFRIVEEDGWILQLEKVTNVSPKIGKENALFREIQKELNEYFCGERKNFSFPFRLEGTEFQRDVWRALLAIPYGETRSYRQMACAIGNPKACRAVGMAVHCNPIAIAVPCHRVIGADGSLTGYAGGLALKKALLELERNHC